MPADPKGGIFFNLATLARLNNGASPGTAADEINTIMRAAGGSSGRFEVSGVQDELVAPVKPALLMLAGAVGLVLLIACVNVANLLLARTAARDHEIAVRRAVGASPGRLIRQLLTESMLLSCIGGLAGTTLAIGAIRLLRALATTLPRRDLGPGVTLPRLDEIAIDASVLTFTIVVAVLTGVLCGLLPALRHARAREADRLRARSASPRVRGALVVAEIAMAMVLLVGGGLLIRSFVKLATNDLGYDSSRVLTFQATTGQTSGPQARAFAEQLVERVGALPDVIAAGYANNLPLVQQSFSRDVGAQPYDRAKPRAPYPGLHAVSPRTIQALGLRIVEGRSFSDGDAGRGEALITRAFARSGFFDGPPIGRRIYSSHTSWEVVGILDDVSQFWLGQRAGSEMYIIDYLPAPPGLGGTYFAIRTGADPSALASSVRGIVRQLDPTATVDNIATMEQIVSNAMARPRLFAVLLGIFAGVAMILAAIGIYGVLGYMVSHRAREIGIRMALGAPRFQVVALVLRQTAVLTVVGVTLGVAGAAALSRYLEGLLFELTPLDVTTFAAVVVMFGVVAALASYVPARRATRVDPLVALRIGVAAGFSRRPCDSSLKTAATTTMRRFIRRCLSLFTRNSAEDDLAREMTAHLALLEAEYQRRGLSPDEARLAARRAMGSVALAKDLHRDARSFRWLDDLRQDATHTVRGLRRAPGFAIVAVLTVALGVGANIAIFGLAYQTLLRPLPFDRPGELVKVATHLPHAAIATTPCR